VRTPSQERKEDPHSGMAMNGTRQPSCVLRERYLAVVGLALFAVVVGCQAILSPVVGVANNGDFSRLTLSVGLSPTHQSHAPLRSFPRYYTWEPSSRGKCFPTSEMIFVVAALVGHCVAGKPPVFDVASMGAVHAVAYVAVFGLLCGAVVRCGGRLQWLFLLLCVLVLGDVAYVAYFNSFYAEAGTLIFLLLAIAISIRIALGAGQGGVPRRWLAALAAASSLFVLAKLQNALLGPVLAFMVYRLSCLHGGKDGQHVATRRYGAWLGAFVLIVSVLYWHLYTLFPMGIRNVNVYDSVFFQIIRTSPTPAADLKELGLDESFVRYKGTHAWSPGVTEEVYDEVYKRVGERGIIRFYLRHPGRFLGLVLRGSKYAFVMRPGYLGNFDNEAIEAMLKRKAAVPRGPNESLCSDSANLLKLPAPYRSSAFSIYSTAKERLFGGKRWPFFAFWLVNLGVLIAKRRLFDRDRFDGAITFVHGAVLVMAALQFATVTMGAGELDIVKHLFVFGITCDMCILFIAGYCLLRRPC
jgi:hypothetical protein